MQTSFAYQEQRKTNKNTKSDILEARIIANYGDPGLDENFHFDILSRYVIVMIESCQRVPTYDKYAPMLVLVKRPEHLWITTASQPDGNTANQKRADANGNVSIGNAGSFSTNGISRIYPAYTFGETIKIRKLVGPVGLDNSFFASDFSNWDTTSWSYNSWHSEGSSSPYFSDAAMKAQIQQKTIYPMSATAYQGILYKMQFEAFSLFLNASNSAVSQGLMSIFDGTWKGNPAVYSANGGYLFSNGRDKITLNYLAYEDVNLTNRQRVASNDCLPMIVTTPNSFPAPAVRALGSIAYNPTYATIIKS